MNATADGTDPLAGGTTQEYDATGNIDSAEESGGWNVDTPNP